MATVKAFNKWSTEGIEVKDEGLKRYICLDPTIVPRTGAKYAGQRFHKSNVFIVERLINRVMVPGHRGKKHKLTSGHCTGKALNAYRIVEKALEYIEKKTGKNPIEVLVRAIENAATREEIVTIEYGGARYPKAVECSPQRRVDLVLRYFVHGAYDRSFKSKVSAEQALAEEILAAYEGSPKSAAVSKKRELERQADASR
ncbi:30S ribosomal protein S7 [Candidatus Woesearchaeota archaeon]|nr:MAG: 30S ribosomal protein S7 [Candidatus Woesearchaeota archaeon]